MRRRCRRLGVVSPLSHDLSVLRSIPTRADNFDWLTPNAVRLCLMAVPKTLSGFDGIERRIRTLKGHIRIPEACPAGATGFLLKDTGREELLAAVRDVAAGRLNIPAASFRRALATFRDGPQPTSYRQRNVLTAREQEILRLFSSGMSYAQIAEAQGNSPPTVRNSIYRIQDKLGVGSKQEMVVWAVRSGLLDDVQV